MPDNEQAKPLRVCPVCSGDGKLFGLFPVYAPDVPVEKRKAAIELKCDFCEGAGQVGAEAMARRERGQQHKAVRLARRIGLREYAERTGISPSMLSRYEQGIAVDEAAIRVIEESKQER